jgi:predicted transcriptional regulator
MRLTRITIIRTKQPDRYSLNELLQWFGGSLGLFNLRDKDRSCFRIFIVLLKDQKKEGTGLSSDEIAEITALSRGTVVHHLNKLMEAGMVISDRNKYYLKVDNLAELVELVRIDTNKTLDSLKDIGKEIDKLLKS